MSVIIQTATTNKTDVCRADTAVIVVYVNRAARKMQFRELNIVTANLNTFQTRINVQAAEFAQDYVPAEYGKLNGVNKKRKRNALSK